MPASLALPGTVDLYSTLYARRAQNLGRERDVDVGLQPAANRIIQGVRDPTVAECPAQIRTFLLPLCAVPSAAYVQAPYFPRSTDHDDQRLHHRLLTGGQLGQLAAGQ